MKIFVITILVSSFIFNGLKSQTPTEKTYGTKYADEIVSSIHLGDSSEIIFMNKYHNDSSAVSIFKTGKDGLPKWTKTTGISNYKINSAIQTADGNMVFAGYVPGNKQYYWGKYFWVAKIDTAGNILWNRMFKFGVNAEATAIIQLPDSSLFIAGSGNLHSEPDYRIVALHLDKNGKELKSFSYYQGDVNFAYDAIFCHDSTILVVGADKSSHTKLLLADFNVNGEVQWNKVLTFDQDPFSNIVASAVARDESNNYYITGHTMNGILGMKLNTAFDLEWSMNFIISEGFAPAGEDIICLNDSVIIIAGNSLDRNVITMFPRPADDIVTLGMNPQGDTLWTSSIGSASYDYMVSLNRVSDSLLFISGSSYGLATEGNYDGYQIGLVPGKPVCNFTHADWVIDTVEFEESENIEVGTGLGAADSTITWMADTIGFHDACLCHPPTALYSWYNNDWYHDEGTVITTNLSVWATDWTWNIGLDRQSKEYHVEFVGDNINLCLSVENECGSDEYCEIVYGGVAVPEMNPISLEAFPVPSSDEVHLRFEMIEGYPDIRIFDAAGKQVGIYPRYTQSTLTLSKTETGSGLFFVVFIMDSKVIAMKKIIFE